MAVEGIIVKPSKFDSDLEVTGAIEANESVVLKSEVSGLVTGIYFNEGANVSKGKCFSKNKRQRHSGAIARSFNQAKTISH